MIKIEKTEVVGWEAAIRGMRNPMNSWEKSDSHYCNEYLLCYGCPLTGGYSETCDNYRTVTRNENPYIVGQNDYDLMLRLVKGGPVHAKFRRMIVVYADITAPLYWWKEYDTYKVGTVANSCSTMHKIADKEFTLDDFSIDHLLVELSDSEKGNYSNVYTLLQHLINTLNVARDLYLRTKDKQYWWQMIQLLPTSYNQKRTVMLSYEVLANIYRSRMGHKLDEWHDFCQWITELPYSPIITTCGKEDK